MSCLIAAGCDTDIEGVDDTAPRVLSVDVLAGQGPIFRTLDVRLDREGAVVVDYQADGDRLRVESDDVAPSHRIFLPRLQADAGYGYAVRPVAAPGRAGAAVEGRFSTGSLPAELDALELDVSGRATFDVLLLEISLPSGPHMPVILDTAGRVVWYSLVEGRSGAGFTLFQDSLYATLSGFGIQVFSPRSQELVWDLSRAETAVRTGIDPFLMHHDVIESPDGTLLFLVADTTLARDTVWTGEAVWEWDPATDALHRRWRSKDFLDPATDRGARSVPSDWLHANSLAVGPRGNVLVSFFWLHEVLSIEPGWGGVEWRLGGPASTFSGVDVAMEAGQHTAAEVAPDRVLLFDNGRDRGEGLYSRALELALDRDRATAEVVWEFRPDPDIYAPIVSSARRLPNGNTVIAFGLEAGFQPMGPEPPASGPLAFMEVDASGRVVWRMDVAAGARLVYRATPLFSVAGERVVR